MLRIDAEYVTGQGKFNSYDGNFRKISCKTFHGKTYFT